MDSAASVDTDNRLTEQPQRQHAKPLAVVIFAACWATALWMRFPFINGPSYWMWWYLKLPAARVAMALSWSGAPVLLAVWGYSRRWWGWKPGIAMVMAGLIALMLSASWIQPNPGGWERAARIIRSPLATSAGAQALRFRHDQVPIRYWLAHYPELMPDLYSHCTTRGPGNVLLQAWIIDLFGTSWRVSYGAAVFIAILAALGVLATFAMIRSITEDEEAGFLAAAFMALCPGFILFFPAMDEVYPLVTCGVAWLCFQMRRTQKPVYALALGALLAVALLCTYVLLVLGVFIVGLAVIPIKAATDKPWTWRAVLKQWTLVLVALAGVYVVLYLTTGFNVIATTRMAFRMVAEAWGWIVRRPYPWTILFDLTDFAMSAGWISVLIILFALWGLWRRRDERIWIVLLGLAQVVAVAVSGLTRGETARLWCFMLPVFLIGVGLELRRWDTGARMAVFVSLWVILAATAGRLMFVGVEPLDKVPAFVLEGR